MNQILMNVEISDGHYHFYTIGGTKVAVTERINVTDWYPNAPMDVDAHFRTIFYMELSEERQMMVLSFPTIKFF